MDKRKLMVVVLLVFVTGTVIPRQSFAAMECHTFATPGGPRTVCVQVPDLDPLGPGYIDKWWAEHQLFPNHFGEYEQ